MKTAIIAGATGLVGNSLLRLLLQEAEYQKVISVSRNAINTAHTKLIQEIGDFENLCAYDNRIKGDVFFCCLGSTHNKTPNLQQYRKIEHLYPLLLANMAKQNGVKQVHFISSIGADMKASSFYLQLKGETEYALQQLRISSLHIYRPSLLVGERKEKRLMENIAVNVMKAINPLLFGSLKKYKSITALNVAKAMYTQSLNTDPGVFIHPSDHIQKLA